MVLFDVLPMRVLPPLFFVAGAYPMIGLRAGLVYAGKTLLVSCCAVVLVLCCVVLMC